MLLRGDWDASFSRIRRYCTDGGVGLNFLSWRWRELLASMNCACLLCGGGHSSKHRGGKKNIQKPSAVYQQLRGWRCVATLIHSNASFLLIHFV